MSTADQLKVLKRIFQDVQSRFDYVNDWDKHQRIDFWESDSDIPDAGPLVGDCDLFARACRKECRESGIASRLVYCKTEVGDGHLILEVDGWALDNRQSRVKSRAIIDYTWISISGYEKGDKWRAIV